MMFSWIYILWPYMVTGWIDDSNDMKKLKQR